MLHSGSGHRAVWRCVFVCLSCWRRGEKDKRNSPKADNKCTDQCMWKQHPNNSKGMRHTQTSWRGPIAQPSPGHGWDSNRFSVRLNDRESFYVTPLEKQPWSHRGAAAFVFFMQFSLNTGSYLDTVFLKLCFMGSLHYSPNISQQHLKTARPSEDSNFSLRKTYLYRLEVTALLEFWRPSVQRHKSF